MSDIDSELIRIAERERSEISSVEAIVERACSAVCYAGDVLLAKLGAKGLDLPKGPVVVDTKKHLGLPQHVDPQTELNMAWSGFRAFWLPYDSRHEERRGRLCFQRLEVIAPELVDFVDDEMVRLTRYNRDYQPDRLSVALPLMASLKLLSTRLISPGDPGVLRADDIPRNDYLIT